MNLPDEQRWLRVEELAEQLSLLPPDGIAPRLAELAAAGESSTVLKMLGTWLSLPPPPVPLQAGSVVAGRYVLREKLGEGGMGSVWRARQEMVGRDVALKMIHPSLVTPALQSRFISEIELLGRLDHPGIVRIFDAGLHEQEALPAMPFFAMELVEGLPLSRWASRHRSERAALLRVAATVCGAVQNAHERRIVHRDLKPSNIIVKDGGQPVVLDFGIARLSGMAAGHEQGFFSGTPQYAAPEQHLGRDGDFRSGESVDVYALGVILFEMLSGRRPLEFPKGTSIAAMRRAVLEDVVPRLSDALPHCPPFLEEIIARALRRDPADRFYSVAALGRAIHRAAALSNPTEEPPAPWVPSAGAIVPGTGWRLTQKIGEGSAGQVWMGLHDQLGSRRIFKFCDTEEKARTLKRELTLFRLLKERVGQNPHFITLHEVSLDEPPWYLMMDDAGARDLETWCAQQPDDLAAVPESLRLEIVAQIAEALQAAHEAGILHRDIKPANVLVKSDSTQVHALIADFGIGQIVANELLGRGTRLGFTRTVADLQHSVLSGTLLYLAPEVLEGRSATARSDIYSLGVLLWQLLIGDLNAALDSADWPSRIPDPLLRADLLRCLSAFPEKRWGSMQELASSLRSLPQRRAAERQRQLDLAVRERAAYRRGVVRTAALAAGLVALLAGLAWFGWERSVEAEKQRRTASVARTRAALGELQGAADLKSGGARAKLFSEMPKLNAREAGVEPALRETAIRILALPVFEELKARPWTPDESGSIAERSERMIRRQSNGQVEMVDLSVEPPSIFPLPGAPNHVSNLRVNANGLAAGAMATNGALHLWHGRELSVTSRIPGPVHAACFAFSPLTLAKSRIVIAAVARPDGAIDIFAVGHTNEPLALRRRSSETEDHFPESRPATMLAFSLSREGILAAAGPDSGNVLFWKIADQKDRSLEGKLAGAAWHPDLITCLNWNPAADDLATGSRDGKLSVWRFAFTGTVPQTTPLHRVDLAEPIRDVAWSPDGMLLAVLLDSGSIRVLKAQVPDQPAITAMHHVGAEHIAFAAGNTLLAWGRTGGRAWGSRDAPFFTERRTSAGEVQVNFQEEGCLTVTGRERTEFLNPSTLARTASFKADSLHAGAWAGSSFFFHSGDKWHSVTLTRQSDPAPSLKLPRGFGDLRKVKRVVASAQGARTAWVYENEMICRRANQEEGRVAPLPCEPRLLAVSDAEPKTVWSDEAGNLHLCDHAQGNEQKIFPGTQVQWLAFAPGSNLLAFRAESGVTFVHPGTLQRMTARLAAPGTALTSVAFSPDGRWIAASEADHALAIAPLPPAETRWQEGGQRLADVFASPVALRCASPRRVVSIAWNACGSRIALGTADGFVQTWNVSLLREKLRLWKLDWGTDLPPAETGFVPVSLD
jgi:serine/threonine protein kinase/WD40 repeat protein